MLDHYREAKERYEFQMGPIRGNLATALGREHFSGNLDCFSHVEERSEFARLNPTR